jgi:hypothetical protein
MPRPMKVKMFMDAKPSTVEEANQCLAGQPQFSNHYKIGNSGHGNIREANQRNPSMHRRDRVV